jgi:hypothetical protein
MNNEKFLPVELKRVICEIVDRRRIKQMVGWVGALEKPCRCRSWRELGPRGCALTFGTVL